MGEDIRVGSAPDSLEGYLAAPAGSPRGGVVVLPARYGLEDGYRRLANALAEQGYLSLALAWQTRESDPSTESVLTDLQQVALFMEERDSGPLAIMGFCRGGTLVLWALARQAVWQAGIALYSLPRRGSKNDPESMSLFEEPYVEHPGAVLILHGVQDHAAPVEDVTAYARKLDAVSAPFEVRIFGDAGHRYFLPTDPDHRPVAARLSWDATTNFLERHLRGGAVRPWEHPARER